jgi:hypothetical protein
MSNPVGVNGLKFSAIGVTQHVTVYDLNDDVIEPANVTVELEGGQSVVSVSESGSGFDITSLNDGGVERVLFKATVNGVQSTYYVDCLVEVNEDPFYISPV